ncbi:MAG: DNA replication and repair protein RecF [Patescibacteria group bacterium]|nr:DNA replication and repair protein RecF [Patescibacteria group bacterium]
MYLKSVSLQNFRNYKKSEFLFKSKTTLIIGQNTAGKTNLMEAIFLLSTGKSFRAQNDFEMISFGEDIGRVKGTIQVDGEKNLEVILKKDNSFLKKYLINGISKRRGDFSSVFAVSLFTPSDLDIIIGSPSLRRNLLDSVIEQVDREYKNALISYSKALRQRNALLEIAREEGTRNEKQFEFWDHLLIENGQLITNKREAFIKFLNDTKKDIFDFVVNYDKSVISIERLLQYKDAELGAAVTLVGPHRDDFSIHFFNDESESTSNIKFFGSRGQQRLAILQLKILEILFIEKKLRKRPVLLLDDIFSELDQGHINHILELIGKQQTIITTAHRELVPQRFLKEMEVVEFGK